MGTLAPDGVYPNPVIGATVSLQLTNQPKGVYQVRLINPVGQVLLNKTIVHAAGSSTEIISLPANCSNGNYMIRISLPDGGRVVEKIVISN